MGEYDGMGDLKEHLSYFDNAALLQQYPIKCMVFLENVIAVDYRQSGPRPDLRLLRQAALEALTRSARTNTPRKTAPEQFPAKIGGGGGGGGVS
ncbi:LRR receptor-like serine/threonine-protein kinase [Dorcoceras hygrometricum]|uniref:LRR receptor-like serine/threonine-protein kinase n=1 Tax=Dorcoceras hygrometricum TaxID=472368 RepID=A0A2Z7AS22_9LAMI|nr:LRR receptor-like serine/threonine-protein kinase [Dorcoceras hygrometricum]